MGIECNICTDRKGFKITFTQADLNMRQRRWLELIEDYDLEVHYRLSKANVVAEAPNRKVHGHCLSMESHSETLCHEMRKLSLEMISQGTLNRISIDPTLHDQVIMAQSQGKGMEIIK
jgi:hypothetical protein